MAAFVVLAPTAASAADAPDEQDFIRYSTTIERSDAPATDVPAENADLNFFSLGSAEVEIRCTGDECRLFGVEPERYRNDTSAGISIELTDGHADVPQDAIGDACVYESDSDFAGMLTVEASASAITITWNLPSVACDRQEGLETESDPVLLSVDAQSRFLGPSTSGISGPDEPELVQVFGVFQRWTGTFTEGDPCIVDSAACPPTPSPSTSDPVTQTPTPTATEASTPTPAESDTVTPRPTETAIVQATPTPAPTLSWGEPSVLSRMRPVSDIDTTALESCIAAAVVLVLVLLIAFPTALLNSAIEELAQRRRRPPREPPRHLSGWWKAAGGVALAALISGFVDPHFGLNEMSGRAFASILVALVIDVLIGWSARIWLVRRIRPEDPVSFTFVPVTLFIVAGAVVLTRITDFQPAVIFGLVAGVVFSSTISIGDKARTELIGLGYGFAAAIAAWMIYTVIPEHDGDVLIVFAQETLAAMAIAGIAALPILMFPLRGLSGYTIFRWRRMVWGLAYCAALYAFFVLLMPKDFAWLEPRIPIGTWAVIYGLYCLASVIAWGVAKRGGTREKESQEPAPTLSLPP